MSNVQRLVTVTILNCSGIRGGQLEDLLKFCLHFASQTVVVLSQLLKQWTLL